jgi:hypothetical protein
MSVRRFGTILAALCAVLMLVPVAASARTRATTPTAIPVKTLSSIPITGTARNGKQFTGHFTVDRFVRRSGKTWAVGTLTGRLGGRFIRRDDVSIPASVVNSTSPTTGSAAATTSCPILHLVLGPLNLNLLGLHVHLNKVVLDITAVPGPGNLLGNLLCSVANLLNQQPPLPLAQFTSLLNILNSILSAPGVLGL